MGKIMIQKTMEEPQTRLNRSNICPTLVLGLLDQGRSVLVNNPDGIMKGSNVQTRYDYAARFYPDSNLKQQNSPSGQ